MGSFNIRCDVTNSAITDYDEIVVVYYVESTIINSFAGRPDPLMWRFVGKYNDYGKIALDKNDPINELGLIYLNKYCDGFFDRVRAMENINGIQNMPNDELLHTLVWEGALTYRGSFPSLDPTKFINTENPYHPSATLPTDDFHVSIRRMVMHRYAYDHLVSCQEWMTPDRLDEVWPEIEKHWERQDQLKIQLEELEKLQEECGITDEQQKTLFRLLRAVGQEVNGEDRHLKYTLESLLGLRFPDGDCFGNFTDRGFKEFYKQIIDHSRDKEFIRFMIEHYNFVMAMRTHNIEFNCTKTFAFEQHVSSDTLSRKVAWLKKQLEFEQKRLGEYEYETTM